MVVAKKAAAKKPVSKHENIRYLSHEFVSLETLSNYHKNPRRGNVRKIAESLFRHGQYRPIVVWAQENGKARSPEILAGNHTYMGAKFLDQIAKGQTDKPVWVEQAEAKLGRVVEPWPQMGVVFINASADEAAEIVVADNRLADLGEYDKDVLQEVLSGISDPFGTGYTQAEFDLLSTVSEKVAAEALDAIVDLDDYDPESENAIIDLNKDLLELEEWKEEAETPQVLLDASEELTGAVIDLKDEPKFPGVTQFEIPALRPDMLIEDLPEMVTWAGSASKGQDIGDAYWFYNYGIDSTSGMAGTFQEGHIVLSFYAWDAYFQTWWDAIKDRTIQALNSKISMAVTPNFSQDEMPMIESMFQLFKSRYVGRYMQEAGIKVMPDLECRHDQLMYDLVKATLPKDLPWASMQAQNIGATTKSKRSEAEMKEWEKYWEDGLVALFGKVVRPANLLVYANENGFEKVSNLNDKHNWGMNLRYQPTRLIALGEKAKLRQKKTGIV